MSSTVKKDRNVGPLAQGTMETRVTYRDTDQMGFVYYANYLVYFEMARTELLRELGSTYDACEKAGVFLPVLQATCQYKTPALYDDLLTLKTRVTRWTRVALDFEYEVRRKSDDTLLATGTTRHAFIDKDGKIIRAGDKIVPK
jgi:acyl-CoA thioester hydrolase